MSHSTENKSPKDQSADSLGISPELLNMLVCPVDKAALEARSGKLVCTKCHREYPVEDGIPNMVVD